MVKTRFAVFLSFIIIISVLLTGCFKGDEKKVRKQLEGLSKIVSKEPGENKLKSIGKIQSIGSLFDEICEFDLDINGLRENLTPDEITGLLSRAHLHFSRLTLKFYDADIFIVSKDKAEIIATVTLLGEVKTREVFENTIQIKCVMQKNNNDKWVFKSFKEVEMLEK